MLGDKEFLPVDRMAVKAGVPLAWLKAEAKAGRIPFLQAGRRIFFHAPTVMRILTEMASETRQREPARTDGELMNAQHA